MSFNTIDHAFHKLFYKANPAQNLPILAYHCPMKTTKPNDADVENAVVILLTEDISFIYIYLYIHLSFMNYILIYPTLIRLVEVLATSRLPWAAADQFDSRLLIPARPITS